MFQHEGDWSSDGDSESDTAGVEMVRFIGQQLKQDKLVRSLYVPLLIKYVENEEQGFKLLSPIIGNLHKEYGIELSMRSLAMGILERIVFKPSSIKLYVSLCQRIVAPAYVNILWSTFFIKLNQLESEIGLSTKEWMLLFEFVLDLFCDFALKGSFTVCYEDVMIVIPSKSFIWVTSKYLGSCWSYRKSNATLLYQTTHSASNEPSFRSIGETFVK